MTEQESIARIRAGSTAGLILGTHFARQTSTNGQVLGQSGARDPSGQHGISSAMADIDCRPVASAMVTNGVEHRPTTARIASSLPKISEGITRVGWRTAAQLASRAGQFRKLEELSGAIEIVRVSMSLLGPRQLNAYGCQAP